MTKMIVEFLKLCNVGEKWAHALAIAPLLLALGSSVTIIGLGVNEWVESERAKEKLMADMEHQIRLISLKQDHLSGYVSDLSKCFDFYATQMQRADSIRNNPKVCTKLKEEATKYLQKNLPHTQIAIDTLFKTTIRVVKK